jgi:hypothetical protein
VLKAERKDKAIICRSDRGSHFYDICVSGNGNANTGSFSRFFGRNYTNDTGLDGHMFFTVSDRFRVKEIEVFEITDQTALPPNRACVLFPNRFSN